jgi:hypothetical protein
MSKSTVEERQSRFPMVEWWNKFSDAQDEMGCRERACRDAYDLIIAAFNAHHSCSEEENIALRKIVFNATERMMAARNSIEFYHYMQKTKKRAKLWHNMIEYAIPNARYILYRSWPDTIEYAEKTLPSYPTYDKDFMNKVREENKVLAKQSVLDEHARY